MANSESDIIYKKRYGLCKGIASASLGLGIQLGKMLESEAWEVLVPI